MQRGNFDLVIDEAGGTVQLPLTCGRKLPQSLKLGEVEAAFVETVTKTDSEGSTSHRYFPSLRLRGDAAGAVRLAEWYDAERASRFVDWVNAGLDATGTQGS